MASYKNKNIELNNTIIRLELEKTVKFEELRNQYKITAYSLKPINILKSTLHDFQELPELKLSILKAFATVAGGYFTKKIFFGKSKTVLKNIIGYVIQYGVTNFISKKVKSD